MLERQAAARIARREVEAYQVEQAAKAEAMPPAFKGWNRRLAQDRAQG